MSTTPTLPRIPSGPPPTRPDARRLVAIVVAVALVGVAILAVAYAAGWFDSTDPDATPIAQPDDTAPTQPDATAPDQPDVAPDISDETEPDQPNDATPTPRYDEEPRANWDVTGVDASDTLNVRREPGTTFPTIATLAHDTAELESTGRIADVGDQLWREIIVPGNGAGWVNAAYLTETAPPTSYSEEPRANWDVTGVDASDTLNVRSEPGTTFPIIATLAHDAAELESTGRIADVGDQLWREIIVPGNGAGWVNTAYLDPTG